MHDAAFELIEIPHTRHSGKNSADIRMVVDALDLCYTKEHIDSFVIISGDSDFSPLVSKLRENNKTVIGVGVKSSTSDLLMSNCDEFIFDDDLAREAESSKQRKRKAAPRKKAASKKGEDKQTVTGSVEEDKSEEDKMDEAIALVMETAEALYAERDDRDKLWGSMVKQALKRRHPGFNERYYGVRSFSHLLEEAERRGLIRPAADEAVVGALPEPPLVPGRRAAAESGSVVTVEHSSVATGVVTIRDIEPWAVFSTLGNWYVSAWCRSAVAERVFRIDRIRTAEVTGETFAPKEEPPKPEVRYTPNEDDTQVTIRLSERAGWVAEHYPVDIIDVTDDVTTIRRSVSDPAVAARLLVRLGDSAELVDGFNVAETVAELRNRILHRYEIVD